MRTLTSQPSLAEQVYQEILSEIVSGRLAEQARLIQDELARDLGVSRHPVQQALLLLHRQGFVRDAPGRGLEVTPIDLDFVRDLYEVRAFAEGLASSLAASRSAAHAAKVGPKLIEEGRRAEREASLSKLTDADVKFHEFLYEVSGNRLIKKMMQPHWLHMRRIMGEVLVRDETPRRIWDQHEEILDAVVRRDAPKAEELARLHITNTARVFIARLAKTREGAHRNVDAPRLRRARLA